MDPRSPQEKIAALLDLIQKSTQEAMEEYEKSGAGIPEPGSRVPHLLDSAPDAIALKTAIRTLEAACEMLCSTLAQPMHTIINRSMPYESACLRLVANAKVADVLQDASARHGLKVEVIASRVHVDSRKLLQMLRLLASRGVFTETAPDTFANNRLSVTLLSTNPISATVGLNTEESLRGVTALPESMIHPDYAFSDEKGKCAFMYSVKDEMPEGGLFDWYANHPDVAMRFNKAMIGWSQVTGSMAITKCFPWKDLPPGATVCDVGSGVGALTAVLAKQYPHLKITLQDLPTPLKEAAAFWKTELPNAEQTGQVSFVPLDFLKEPPVKGQDIYYMKHIMHDWPDSDAIRILRHVAEAMAVRSKLLIHDLVLQYSCGYDSMSSSPWKAPEPLLPNYGTGNVRLYNQNLNMVAMFNSRERTFDEFLFLGREAGLRLHRIWDLSETCVLEFVLSATCSL